MKALDPDVLLAAYAQGAFPMGTGRDTQDIEWYSARQRGIIPLGRAHVPRRLQKTLRQHNYDITINRAFEQVIAACAAPRTVGPWEDADSWINPPIIAAYTQLHRRGHAHSLEVWRSGALIGGIYGVHLGRAFFAESMVSHARDGSKIALVHLLARLHTMAFCCSTRSS